MSEERADPQTEQIIAAAIEVHRHLGPGLLESIYEEALCHEFALRSIPFEQQKPVQVIYKGKAMKGEPSPSPWSPARRSRASGSISWCSGRLWSR